MKKQKQNSRILANVWNHVQKIMELKSKEKKYTWDIN